MGKFVRESPGCYHDDGDVVCDLELPYQPYQTLPTKYPSTRSCFENFTSRRRRPYALIHCPRNLFDTQDSCNYTGLTDSCNLSPAASVRHLFSSVQFNHPLALQCLEAQQHLCATLDIQLQKLHPSFEASTHLQGEMLRVSTFLFLRHFAGFKKKRYGDVFSIQLEMRIALYQEKITKTT